MGVGEKPISGMCAQQFCEAGNWVWTVRKRSEVSGTRPEVSPGQKFRIFNSDHFTFLKNFNPTGRVGSTKCS